MNLPKFSVERPIFTTMVTLIVVVIGAASLSRLRIDLLPDIEMPNLTITTGYEGASPEVMERMVTQPIEEIVGTVPGVEEIFSTSSEGRSNVRVRFAWGTDIDTAGIDVQAKLEDEINELPEDVVRPQVRKFDIAGFPVVILGIASRLDPVELTELIEDQIRYRFARIPGVAQVDLWGGFNREVRIELDPDRIKAIGLPFSRIIDSLRNANIDLPAGKIEQGKYEVTLRAPAEFESLDEIGNTVVYTHEGAAVTLAQISDIHDTYEKLTRIIRVNGERGVRAAIRKQADANTVEVSKRVLEQIEQVNEAFPQVSIIPVINQGNFIERSIANVGRSVGYGGLLAVAALLFFLRNLRSTLVISLAIPISMIATFALIYFGGFTLNLMTLGGLALGVGMMVDNSIVVLENIFRHREEKNESPLSASVFGAVEVGPAIVASTVTTLVIFLPLIFVRGISGVLFTELSYVMIFSLICSLVVSLSLVPMMASRMPVHQADRRPAWIVSAFGAAESFFNAINRAYLGLLGRALKRKMITLASAALVFGASLFLLSYIGTEFMPPSDEGEVHVTGEMEIGTRLFLVDQQTRKMEEIVYASVPEAVSSIVSVGASGWRPDASAEGRIRMSLTPSAQRSRSNTEIATDLRHRLAGQIPGMEIRTRAPQGQFLLDRLLGGEEGLSIEIRGFDLNTLDILATRVSHALSDVPGITDVTVSRKAGVPQEEIRVDRNKAADLGLSVRDVTDMLGTAVAGRKAGEYRSGGSSHPIRVQLRDAQERPVEEILDLTIAVGSGQQVAVNNLVTVSPGLGPVLIDRKDQQRLVTVYANVAGRDLGSVAADVEDRLDTIARPSGYALFVAGDFEEQQKAFRELLLSFMLALVLVYMVLACQYESLRNPLVVMFSVPFAAVGVLVTLFFTNTTINVQSGIGCIMLGGIVVNNAILLVDQAGRLSRGGMTVYQAVMEAGRRRLRPILMTTLTTIFGLMPLAFGIGEGADTQAPLARAVVGGLAGSTLITLVLIPVLYCLFHESSEKKPT